MKRFLFFAIVSFALCACNNQDRDFDPDQDKLNGDSIFYSSINIGESYEFILPPTGGKVGFTITSEYDMNYSTSEVDWARIDKENAPINDNNGSMQFVISVDPFTTWQPAPDYRDYYLSIDFDVDGNIKTTTITIRQGCPYLSMKVGDQYKDSHTFDWDKVSINTSNNTPLNLTIESNLDWEMTSDVPNWLDYQKTSFEAPKFDYETGIYDNNKKTIQIIPTSYYFVDSGRDNSFTISFKCGKKTFASDYVYKPDFKITQSALPFEVIRKDNPNNPSVTFEPCNSAQEAVEFLVSSPKKWKVINSSGEDWFNFTPAGDAGDDKLLSFGFNKTNGSYDERSAKVKVACVVNENIEDDNLPYKEITVRQFGYQLGVSTLSNAMTFDTSVSFGNNELKSKSFYTYSSGKWTITNVAPGLTIGGTLSGSGMEYGERVSAQNLTCAFNERNYDDEDCTLYFTLQSEEEGATNLSQKIAVVQEKYVLDAELKNTPLPVKEGSATENFGTMSIESSGDWQVESSATWLSFSKTSGSGNESITFWATSINPNTTERAGEIRLISTTHTEVGKSLEREYTVKQQPFIFSVNKTNLTFAAIGSASQEVKIFCSAGWSVKTKPAWVTVNPASGNGDGQISISVDQQYVELSDRTGELYLANDFNDKELKISIKQEGFIFNVGSTPNENATIPSAANTNNYSDMQIKLNVECDGGYTVSCSYDQKRDNDDTTIDIPWNQNSNSRDIKIIVTSNLGKHTKELKFKQDGLSFDDGLKIVRPAANKGVADEDNDKITFKSSGAWVVVYKDNCDSWMKLVDDNGKEYTKDTMFKKTENLTLYVETTEDNDTGEERKGFVYLCLLQSKDSESTDEEKIGYGKSKEIRVIQSAK